MVLTGDEALIGRTPTRAERNMVMAYYAHPPSPLLPAERSSLFGSARRLQRSSAAGGYLFISYARKDFDRIALTLDQIQQIGHDVWWDVDIEPAIDARLCLFQPGPDESGDCYWLKRPREHVNVCGPFYGASWLASSRFLFMRISRCPTVIRRTPRCTGTFGLRGDENSRGLIRPRLNF
jgi:hypothetical protein